MVSLPSSVLSCSPHQFGMYDRTRMPCIKAFTAAPEPHVRTSDAFAKSCSSGIQGLVPGCPRTRVQPGGIQFLGVPLGPIPRCMSPTLSPPSGRQSSRLAPSSSQRSGPPSRMLSARLWNRGQIEYQRPPRKSFPQVAFSAIRTLAPRLSAASATDSNRPYLFQIRRTSHFCSVVSVNPAACSPWPNACLR